MIMMATKEKSIYESLAGLLQFPGEDIKLRVEECIKMINDSGAYPSEAVDDLQHFLDDLEKMPLDDLQGYYSYTFELTAEHTLDLGHHLFDGFKRSNTLASLKAMYRENKFPVDEVAKGELADHLPVLLRFLAVCKDEALKKDLLSSLVNMAVEKLMKSFERNPNNVYGHLVNATYRVLDKDVKEVQ